MMELSDGYPMEAMFAQIAELSLEVGGIHCEPPHGWGRIRGDTVIHQDRYTDGSHRNASPPRQAAVNLAQRIKLLQYRVLLSAVVHEHCIHFLRTAMLASQYAVFHADPDALSNGIVHTLDRRPYRLAGGVIVVAYSLPRRACAASSRRICRRRGARARSSVRPADCPAASAGRVA